MQVIAGPYYLSPAARETLKAHNAAVRARLELKREERDAVAEEFAKTLTSAATKQDARRFTGEPCTGFGGLL